MTTPIVVGESTEFVELRRELVQAAIRAAKDQRRIYHEGNGCTVEYSMLGNLCDALNAATMLTHTIDRIRMDERHARHTQALASTS